MKKSLSILLVFIMLFTLFAGCKKTETPLPGEYSYVTRELPEAKYISAAKNFAGGSGTKKDPYKISSAAELRLFEQKINDEKSDSSYNTAYYILTKDITLNDTSDFKNWEKTGPEYSWNPIGGTSAFSGNFNGDGHTISGMYINLNNEDSTSAYGLFAKLSGTVSNLKINKSYIAVSGYSSYVGFVAGELIKTAVIKDCTVDGIMDCYDGEYGGIVGTSIGNYQVKDGKATGADSFAKISNCIFNGEINQLKLYSLNILAGIIASGSAEITKCTNNGTITFDGSGADTVGGIIGRMGFSKISDCINNGYLNCMTLCEGTGVTAGGIAGKIFTMDAKAKGETKSIVNCENKGKVSAQLYSGGIAGSLINDNTNWCVKISGCTNSGEIVAPEYIGGIVGYLSSIDKNSNSENVVIENCTNNANLTDGTVGGIISSVMLQSGDITVKNCKNTGNLSTTEQNAAGIIAYWLMKSEIDTKVIISTCSNTGKIKSSLNAGGILCYTDNPVGKTISDSTKITVKGCKNSGEITVDSVNGYIGGIAANIGMKNIYTTFDSCENTGKLFINNKKADDETLTSAEESGLKLSRVCGGIIGKAGKGLFLDTDNDNPNAENINKKNAYITVKNCKSTGEFVVNDATEYKTESGELIYENFFGGIIGNASAESEFSISVENSNYTNFDRGLGNKDLPDVGKKTS